jgi:hypothetical protein
MVGPRRRRGCTVGYTDGVPLGTPSMLAVAPAGVARSAGCLLVDRVDVDAHAAVSRWADAAILVIGWR